MKQLLRYLVNTILFVVIWCIPAFLFVGYSVSVNGTRPSGIAAIGGIIAIIISYRVVKRINKSNLWASLFDETEVVNEVVEEKKVEVVDSNIFNPKNITIGILAIVLISFLFNQNYNISEKEPITIVKDVENYLSDYVIDNSLNRYSLYDDIYQPQDLRMSHISGAIKGPMLLKSSKQPITGIVYFNLGESSFVESTVKNGNLNGVTKVWHNVATFTDGRDCEFEFLFEYNNLGNRTYTGWVDRKNLGSKGGKEDKFFARTFVYSNNSAMKEIFRNKIKTICLKCQSKKFDYNPVNPIYYCDNCDYHHE